MTASVLRTINVAGQPLLWPSHDADEHLDYSLIVKALLLDIGNDPVSTVDVSISPSGPGELVASALSYTAALNLITLWLSGGRARLYHVRVALSTFGGRAFSWSVFIRVVPELAVWPVPQPQSRDFGASLLWNASDSQMKFSLSANAAYLALL